MSLQVSTLIKRQKKTAYAVAADLDGHISRASLYRLAAGDKVKVSAEEVQALCEYFGVTPNDLFGYRERG